MANVVYLLCALTSAICAILLIRGYRRTREPLLFWSSCCFGFLFIANVALVCDLILFPNIDFSYPRLVPGLIGVGLLLFGLIWESH